MIWPPLLESVYVKCLHLLVWDVCLSACLLEAIYKSSKVGSGFMCVPRRKTERSNVPGEKEEERGQKNKEEMSTKRASKREKERSIEERWMNR